MLLKFISAAFFANNASTCTAPSPAMMPMLRVAKAGITNPFGDERTVKQAFPAGVGTVRHAQRSLRAPPFIALTAPPSPPHPPPPQEEADPFLMCDYFSMPSPGVSADPDHFPVDWHPHRGMDILSYIKTGLGRHGDSMGNRETFATPGMQWISCGSGIEHAEGGGTPAGQTNTGFQIWINVPAARKMDDPQYGTEDAAAIPQEEVGVGGAQARLMSGPWREGKEGARTGAMRTQTPTHMVDFELAAGAVAEHAVPAGMDTALLYVYRGDGEVAGAPVPEGGIAVLDATADAARGFAFRAGAGGAHFMLFSGKKLREPVAWHGPIVMNTQAEIRQCFAELQGGTFPPKRVAWDYKRIASKPAQQ